MGIVLGKLEPGPLNAITDVEGVRVGHATISKGESEGAIRPPQQGRAPVDLRHGVRYQDPSPGNDSADH